MARHVPPDYHPPRSAHRRVLWAASAAATLPIFMPRLQQRLPLIPHTHVDVVSGAAAACSFIGELFMLKALLVYQSTEKKASDAHRVSFSAPRLPAGRLSRQ